MYTLHARSQHAAAVLEILPGEYALLGGDESACCAPGHRVSRNSENGFETVGLSAGGDGNCPPPRSHRQSSQKIKTRRISDENIQKYCLCKGRTRLL